MLQLIAIAYRENIYIPISEYNNITESWASEFYQQSLFEQIIKNRFYCLLLLFSSERRDSIPEIYQNIHESIYMLVQHMTILGLEYQSYASKDSAAYILSMGGIAPEYMNEVSPTQKIKSK